MSDLARAKPSSQPTTNRETARLVEFAPGIRIDYSIPQVEVEASVGLRSGQLELFAYSHAAVPKEHESILFLEVEPLRIYEALGLIGLSPGHPARYMPETETIRPASGDRVDVLVRYLDGEATREVSACDWMVDLAKGSPMSRTHWIFAGSERTAGGGFLANREGTVVSVVDFTSSLLALPSSHSDSDEALWLAARTDVIPALGTQVTMVLRPALGIDEATSQAVP